MHIRVERPRLRQVVEIEFLNGLHFRHFLGVLERLPRLGIERVRIGERTLMVGRNIFLYLRRVLQLLAVAGRYREVRRVVEHIFLLGLDIDLHVRYGERGTLLNRIGHLADRISLCFRIERIEGLGEFHVRIERVEVRRRDIGCVAYIGRNLQLSFLREESSYLHRCRERELIVIVHITAQDIALDTSVTCRLHLTGYIELRNIGDPQGYIRHCCYTALLVKLRQP